VVSFFSGFFSFHPLCVFSHNRRPFRMILSIQDPPPRPIFSPVNSSQKPLSPFFQCDFLSPFSRAAPRRPTQQTNPFSSPPETYYIDSPLPFTEAYLNFSHSFDTLFRLSVCFFLDICTFFGLLLFSFLNRTTLSLFQDFQ